MNEKKRVKSIAELSKRGRPCYVILRRSAGFDDKGRLKFIDVEIPLHHALTASEREEIDYLFRDPLPPLRDNPVTGVQYRDGANEEYMREVNDILPIKRMYARVVRMLGAEQLGIPGVKTGAELEAGIAVLRNIEGISPEDIMSIDQQGRNPNEVTEAGIQAIEQKESPTTPAAS